MRIIKPASRRHVRQVERAIALLRSARDLLKAADCPKTVQRVRLALTSAGGAERHVRHRSSRTRG
jgi:hypothetical protein